MKINVYIRWRYIRFMHEIVASKQMRHAGVSDNQ